MKKKIMSLALASLLACSIMACGGAEKQKAEQTSSNKNEATEEIKAEENLGEWKPDENVTFIVAYKAGSGTDNTARVLSEYLTKKMGHTAVIKNLEGGSGSIGWTALSQSKPDGYTLGFVNLPTLCSNIVEGLGDYTMDDFEGICNHVSVTSMVLVKADSPFDTLEDLVTYAKEHPGELKASTNGNKASNHIGAQLLAKSAGFEYKAIPYGGTADQLLALRGGEVDFSVAKEADIASMKSDVKVLGVYSPKRLESFPDVPTLGELGYYDKWYGSRRAIVAPKGTDEAILKYYEKVCKEAMEDPEYKEAAKKAGIITQYMDIEETNKMLQEQYEFCTDEISKLWE